METFGFIANIVFLLGYIMIVYVIFKRLRIIEDKLKNLGLDETNPVDDFTTLEEMGFSESRDYDPETGLYEGQQVLKTSH